MGCAVGLSARQNELRTIRRADPRWMPWRIGLTKTIWKELGAELERVVLRHPRTWPDYHPGQVDWQHLRFDAIEDPAEEFVDSWGCARRTGVAGHRGTVTGHVLADWSAFEGFTAPDPDRFGHVFPIDWEQVRRQAAAMARSDGLMDCWMGLDHGFHLLRLEYLRGFENLMIDLLDEPPQFRRLVDLVHAYNKQLLARWLRTEVPLVALPEDLGMQRSSMMGPRLFRKWITPYHKELHDAAHAAGRLTYFHCDGNIMDVADEMLAIRPDVLNVQDLANGVAELAAAFKGKVCIDLDFDRQRAMPFGAPKEIEELVGCEVGTLGCPAGGLSITAHVRSMVPPENIDALASALERYSTYWFD